MITIGDMIGEQADELSRKFLAIGDVHKIPLGKSEHITPKDGMDYRSKYLIILGFNSKGDAIGGVVINSNISLKLPPAITDYYFPVSTMKLPFLHHNSFVNCTHIIRVRKDKFNRDTYRGRVEDTELLLSIKETLKECPTISRQELAEFSIV